MVMLNTRIQRFIAVGEALVINASFMAISGYVLRAQNAIPQSPGHMANLRERQSYAVPS